jgi:hypothetical protein
MSDPLHFPLSWPVGWKRTNPHRRERSRFKRNISPYEGAVEVHDELRKMGARNVVTSTNIEVRQDGLPYANRRIPEDPGVAVYFKFEGTDLSLACDRWRTVGENLRALAKHIEALRGQERWGVGSLEQAFAGYKRIEATSSASTPQWQVVLGLVTEAYVNEDMIKAAFRARAHAAHPDRPGGSASALKQLVEAKRQALQELEKVKG